MPAPVVASLAKKAGKSPKEGESLWKRAKSQAEKQGRSEDYAYITGVYKRMLGLNESDIQLETTVAGMIPSAPNPLEMIGPFSDEERKSIVKRLQSLFPGATESTILRVVFGSQPGELSETVEAEKAFE